LGHEKELAVFGGKPIRSNTLSYGRQCINREDEKAVLAALRSDFLTQGPRIEEFEQAFSAYVKRRFAVAFSSGTAALHASYYALGLGNGDSLLTVPMTFAATANAALFVGASVAFADVQPETGLIDPARIDREITKKTKAICVVHYGGALCAMDEVNATAKRHGIPIVEDACHALGAEGYGASAGRFGKLAVFSFHPVKPITTGEGGMVVTDSAKLYERMKAFRSHGISKSPRLSETKGPWFYEMRELGFNYRLTDIQCALGLSQLKRYDEFLRRRRDIAADYDSFFSDFDAIRPCTIKPGVKSAYHLYPVLVDGHRYKGGRKMFFKALQAEGIGVQVHYIPVNMHPYYKSLGFKASDTPCAKSFYDREISIPIHPGMTKRDIADVKNAFLKIHNALGR